MRVTLPLFPLLPIFCPILAARYDMISQPPESWISDDHFSTIVQNSFPFSICCNIYLSDYIPGVETLFNQFRRVYPNQYLLKERNHQCQGYFLLGADEAEIINALKKVPSSISTTEILILLNTEIIGTDSNILNASIYENANVNVVSLAGIWTLSENYINPRVFHKVKRLDEMVHHYDVYDLQGRELQVCTFYRPPVSYLKRTVNRTINGIDAEVFLMDDVTEIDGIELKLFLLIAEKLNFTWTMRRPIGPYRYGRRINQTTWKGGMVQMIQERKVDLAFASIWLTAEQNSFINLTEHWFQVFIHFLVPRPRPTTSFWALTKPFTSKAWIILVLTILVKSTYVYTRAWIDPKFPKRFRHFLTTITELIGRLLGMIVTNNVTYMRLQMMLWHTAGWLIIAAYSSSLAARLASSDYEPRIDTVEEFLEANLTWGREGAIPPFGTYFDLTDPQLSHLPERYVPVKNDEHVHELVAKGKYAILGKIVGTSFFPEDFVDNADLSQYRLMKEVVGQFYATFAVQSWLLKPINRIMLYLRQSGIVALHLQDVLRRKTSMHLREVLVEHDGIEGHAKVLTLNPLGAGFALLIIGLLISSIVFYFELKRAAETRQVSIQQVLCEIARKRELHELRRTNTRIRLNTGTFYLTRLQQKSH